MSNFYFELKNQDQFDVLTSNSKVCVLDFYTKWCGPCKALAPALEKKVTDNKELSANVCTPENYSDLENLKSKITFVKIDVDQFDELASTFQISSIPHIAFYSNGKLTQNVIRGNNPDGIISNVNKLFESQ